MTKFKNYFLLAISIISVIFIITCTTPTPPDDTNVEGGGGGGGGGGSGIGPVAINLGAAGNYVILSKSGISTVPASVITGDIGVSPIGAGAITGFDPVSMDISGTYSTASQVIGKIFASDYTELTPTNLTAAILNMEAAYTDAAGRTLPDFTDLGAAGNLDGLTLVPGLYKWTTGISITTNLNLSGSPTDRWIFQISGGITMGPGATVTLIGGALPANIFWQATGVVALNTTAHIDGIVLGATGITLATGATANGRLFAQTAVTLDANTVTQP